MNNCRKIAGIAAGVEKNYRRKGANMSKNTMSATANDWSADPVPENFREQAESLDVFLQAEALKNPSNRCKKIEEFVETFYHSGSAQMHAQLILSQSGYHALASLEGIQWLRETYPSA